MKGDVGPPGTATTEQGPENITLAGAKGAQGAKGMKGEQGDQGQGGEEGSAVSLVSQQTYTCHFVAIQ